MTPRPEALLQSLLQACLLLSLSAWTSPACAAETQELGRLFNTPQQRIHLDDLRRRNIPIERPRTAESEQSISLQGIVRRSSGHDTVWINGQPRQTQSGVRPLNNTSAQVSTGNGRAIELKVGEKLQIRTPTETRDAAK